MKTLMKHLLCLSALLVLADTAQAVNITVDAGGTCALADAITSANTDTATGGCPAGSGDDIISLKTDVTLAACLPEITSVVIIKGGRHTIDGNDCWSVLKIFQGSLILNKLTVTGGHYGISSLLGGGGSIILNNSTVSGNGGSGIYLEDSGSIILNNSTVSGNGGSGIYLGEEGSVILNNSTVSGNGSTGIWSTYSGITLNNSTVSDNGGSGIFIGRGRLTLNNTTVSGNGGSGVAVSSSYGWITLNNSTVSGNAVGVYARDAIVKMQGSLVSGNSVLDIKDNDSYWQNSHNVLGHSGKTNAEAFYSDFYGNFVPDSTDITATSDGTNPTALDAILKHLADNGGLTQTHALPKGSPAIDLDTVCSTELITDQRGYPRPVGAGCDAGAYERGGVLQIALEAVTALNAKAFKNKNMGKTFSSQINQVIALVEEGIPASYTEALDKLQNSIIGKTDGCVASGAPDSNDWIKDCASQAQVYPLIQEAIGYLEDMI